jgi:putative FmdB family regulatory protein
LTDPFADSRLSERVLGGCDVPLYDYRCSLCQTTTDHHRKLADRLDKADCESCGGLACCKLLVSAPHYHGERRVGSNKLIHSEIEVVQERGPRWRDEGTTGKEGGAGKKLHFHR